MGICINGQFEAVFECERCKLTGDTSNNLGRLGYGKAINPINSNMVLCIKLPILINLVGFQFLKR